MLKRQGKYAEALASYRRGHELGMERPDWRFSTAQVVRQAEFMVDLENKLPAFLRGEFSPGENSQRLTLAGICRFKTLNRAAAHLYADAFAADPKLADDLRSGHRYNAACHASLAAGGRGEDAADLDEPERSRLRRRALDWLRADLAHWARVIDDGQTADRATARQALAHWRKDADLVPVRDADALSKLAEAERKEWEALWADVEALLKRAQGRAP